MDREDSAMSKEHIVKSYDEELRRLNDTIVEMGGMTEAQIAASIEALMKRNPELSERVIEDDDKVDELNYEVDSQATRLLALRQPMALDLRNVVAALKISSDLERIADYASNIARRGIALCETAPVRPIHAVPRMSRLAQQMIKDVLDAYIERDVSKAIAVWRADEEVDEMYVSLFRELLTYMMEDPRNITPCTHVLFIAKNIERIGDHITNISETIYFLVHGERMREDRARTGSTGRIVQLPFPNDDDDTES
jgi:phosphate transport system protein